MRNRKAVDKRKLYRYQSVLAKKANFMACIRFLFIRGELGWLPAQGGMSAKLGRKKETTRSSLLRYQNWVPETVTSLVPGSIRNSRFWAVAFGAAMAAATRRA